MGRENQTAGLGFVFKDPTGRVVSAAVKIIYFNGDMEFTEAIAISFDI